MAGTLGLTTQTESSPSTLISGDVHLMKKIVLASGSGTVARGTVLGQITASYKWAPLAPAASDGTQVARCILAELESAVVPADDDLVANAYFAGMYRDADLVWPSGITNSQKAAALQQLADRGILVIEEGDPLTIS